MNNKRHNEAMHFLLDLPPMETGHKVEQIKRISMPSRIPRTHPTMLSKKKRSVDWQKTSHGWVRQNSQFSM